MNYIDYYDNDNNNNNNIDILGYENIKNDNNIINNNIAINNNNNNNNNSNNSNNIYIKETNNHNHHNHNLNNQCNKKLYTDIYIDSNHQNNSSKMSINISSSTTNSNINNNNVQHKNLKKTFITKFGFRSIVIFLIFVPYIYILNYAIFPWMESNPYKGKIHSIVSMVLAIQVLSNYYLTSTIDPGSFKDTTSPSYYLAHPISHDYEEKFCNKCNEQKPERAHHCRYCNRCVLRLDHHCQWINNCVGYFNQKYFVLFLFYTSIAIIYFFILLINRTIELVTKHSMEKTLPDFDLLHLFLLGFLIIVLIIAAISIMALLSTQIYLISKNLTTIENEDKKRKHSQPNCSNLYKKYDKGSIIANFSTVFGSPSIYWLLPTPPNLLHKRGDNNKKGDIFIV